MYHHFRNKAELFEAVCDLLSREAMAAIEKAVAGQRGSLATLKAGSLAWVDFMARDDVRRILVVEAPSVLGQERWRALDERYSFPLLREGIREAMEEGALHFSGSAEGLAVLLNGAMNALVLNDPWAENLPRLRRDLLALFDCFSGERP
jgi:AcrR family transcriptional regulator